MFGGGGGRIRLHNENETRNSSTSIVAKYTLILTLSWEMALSVLSFLSGINNCSVWDAL